MLRASLRFRLRNGRRITPTAAVDFVRRGIHSTRIASKESDGGGDNPTTGWPTAESVILQRVSSGPSIHPSFSHLKNDKEPEEDGDKKERDSKDGGDDDGRSLPVYSGSISSVSGIINSVRETRAASQRSPWHKDDNGNGREEEGVRHFDTYAVVRGLAESGGFTRTQATALMTVIGHRVSHLLSSVRSQMLSRSDLENDAYLFRAALQELRMEMQMTRKNDQSILESQAAAVHREIESLAQRTNDQIANLR
ncbi:hypothetical protein GGI21_004828, partial [Coemansia aciculifera]